MARTLVLAVLALTWMTNLMAQSFPDFEKLPAQTELPDPLVMLDGGRIGCAKDWEKNRRPELKALFQHYMYGWLPEVPQLDIKLEREDKNYFGGKATKKEVAIRCGPEGTPVIHLLLVIPNNRKRPAPAFLGTNFNGNHQVLNDPAIALPTAWVPHSKDSHVKDNHASDGDRGKEVNVWCIESTVARGYAVGTFYCGDVEPDRAGPNGGGVMHPAEGGIQHYLLEHGRQPAADSCGAVAAWAWGLHRAMDYLVSDPDVDGSKVAVVGHSRLGKAAIVAAAFDERFAMAIPLQAGCGGTAPSRGKIGEPVARINKVFPHWFSDTFKEFNEHTEKLPFDQNCLIALVAPRPVLFSNATEDTWANPAGQFDVLKAADPVYRFLGAGGLEATAMPETGKLLDSTLGYFIRPGKHSMAAIDWNAFADFADKHWGKPE